MPSDIINLYVSKLNVKMLIILFIYSIWKHCSNRKASQWLFEGYRSFQQAKKNEWSAEESNGIWDIIRKFLMILL